MNKKLLEETIMSFMDEFVDEYFVFNEPIIKKDDSIRRGKCYGSGETNLINFMFQVKKPTRKDIKAVVNSFVLSCDALLD